MLRALPRFQFLPADQVEHSPPGVTSKAAFGQRPRERLLAEARLGGRSFRSLAEAMWRNRWWTICRFIAADSKRELFGTYIAEHAASPSGCFPG